MPVVYYDLYATEVSSIRTTGNIKTTSNMTTYVLDGWDGYCRGVEEGMTWFHLCYMILMCGKHVQQMGAPSRFSKKKLVPESVVLGG
jgi:hypothetical protein